ncbi:hypothetical protein D5S19_05550 [Amycolatopsis panacis]|uniref:Uncharacterized protein n=1 Tax=Amycolatopsis panacis TaxID=2340917 RepID=A0A419I9B6_9PSEU|nr:hypothetical protein D5S19_05550 [Amycolatopsis panacis]
MTGRSLLGAGRPWLAVECSRLVAERSRFGLERFPVVAGSSGAGVADPRCARGCFRPGGEQPRCAAEHARFLVANSWLVAGRFRFVARDSRFVVDGSRLAAEGTQFRPERFRFRTVRLGVRRCFAVRCLSSAAAGHRFVLARPGSVDHGLRRAAERAAFAEEGLRIVAEGAEAEIEPISPVSGQRGRCQRGGGRVKGDRHPGGRPARGDQIRVVTAVGPPGRRGAQRCAGLRARFGHRVVPS